MLHSWGRIDLFGKSVECLLSRRAPAHLIFGYCIGNQEFVAISLDELLTSILVLSPCKVYHEHTSVNALFLHVGNLL